MDNPQQSPLSCAVNSKKRKFSHESCALSELADAANSRPSSPPLSTSPRKFVKSKKRLCEYETFHFFMKKVNPSASPSPCKPEGRTIQQFKTIREPHKVIVVSEAEPASPPSSAQHSIVIKDDRYSDSDEENEDRGDGAGLEAMMDRKQAYSNISPSTIDSINRRIRKLEMLLTGAFISIQDIRNAYSLPEVQRIPEKNNSDPLSLPSPHVGNNSKYMVSPPASPSEAASVTTTPYEKSSNKYGGSSQQQLPTQYVSRLDADMFARFIKNGMVHEILRRRDLAPLD